MDLILLWSRDKLRCERCESRQVVISFLAPNHPRRNDRMRFSTAAFMMVLAVCVTPLPAIAVQPAMSEAQAHKLSESVFTEVLARAQNLHGIAESLNGHEAQAVGEICVSATVANDNVQWFASLATIYQRMESQNDKSEVQMWAARQLDSTKKALEIHINHINSL